MLEDQSVEDETAARRRAMGLLARALASELTGPLTQRFADHGAKDLKPVETGLAMLRGRAGGDGAPFNLGEATVTRAIVELPGGERGYAHILGRDAELARLAAIFDALWQKPDQRRTVETCVLEPIVSRLEAARARRSAISVPACAAPDCAIATLRAEEEPDRANGRAARRDPSRRRSELGLRD